MIQNRADMVKAMDFISNKLREDWSDFDGRDMQIYMNDILAIYDGKLSLAVFMTMYKD